MRASSCANSSNAWPAGAEPLQVSPCQHATPHPPRLLCGVPQRPARWRAQPMTSPCVGPCSRSRHVGLRAHGATEHVWLSCGGRWLQDDRPVLRQGVHKDSTIDFSHRLGGGGDDDEDDDGMAAAPPRVEERGAPNGGTKRTHADAGTRLSPFRPFLSINFKKEGGGGRGEKEKRKKKGRKGREKKGG